LLSSFGEDKGSQTGEVRKTGKVKENSVGSTSINHNVFGTGVGLAVNWSTNDGLGYFGDHPI